MKRNKTATAMTVFVLLASMLTLTLNIQPVKATWIGGTIIIEADGSVYSDDAPISVDGNVYTLTDDILIRYYGGFTIIVWCSDIVLDGDGHTMQPYHPYVACDGIGSVGDNVIIRNIVLKDMRIGIGVGAHGNIISGNTIINCWSFSILVQLGSSNIIHGNTILDSYNVGITIDRSDSNIISGNTIIGAPNKWGGIDLSHSSYNIISENNIESSNIGITLLEASDNTFYHNNLIENTLQVYDRSWDHPYPPSVNVWDNGYPSGGNYWSDYEGIDENDDGIGDTPYFIYTDNQDDYPLMEPWTLLESIEELTEIIMNMNLPQRTGNSLTSKLGEALKLLDKGNFNGAIHKLGDFIDQVEAQREKALTNEQADYLILKAQIIISQIQE